MSASVNVVKLALSHRVINIDGSHQQFTLSTHLLQSVDSSSGLLRYTNQLVGHLGPLLLVSALQFLLDDGKNNLEFLVLFSLNIWQLTSLGKESLPFHSLVDQKSSITSVVNQQIWAIAIGPGQHLVGAVPVPLEGLSFPGKHISSLLLHDSSSSVVLSGENVAASPPNFSTHFLKGLNKDGSLDGHVETSTDFSSLEWLVGEFLSAAHKPYR